MCLMFDQAHSMPNRMLFISQSLIKIMCVSVLPYSALSCSVLYGLRLFMYTNEKCFVWNNRNEREYFV